MGSVDTHANTGGIRRGGVPIIGNRFMAVLATTADGDLAVTTAVAQTPRGDSNVQVEINGAAAQVGDGTKVAVDCYFSGDSGTTARAIKDVVAGDQLFWNGTVAGYELQSTDRASFLYDV